MDTPCGAIAHNSDSGTGSKSGVRTLCVRVNHRRATLGVPMARLETELIGQRVGTMVGLVLNAPIQPLPLTNSFDLR